MRRFIAIALLALASAASAAPKTKVAVMDVKNVQGVAEGTATILTDIVASEISRYGIEVVSKADIAAIVGFEKQKALLGCSDDSSCLAEIGGALGVDYMLTGQVGQIGSRYRISLILVDVKKGKVAGRAADFCDKNEDALANAVLTRVREIVGIVQAGGAEKAAAAAARAEPKAAEPAKPPAPVAAPPPPPVAAEPAPGEPPGSDARTAWFGDWNRRKIIGASLTGGGALLFLGGMIAGVKARSMDQDLKDLSASHPLGFYYDYPKKRDDVTKMAHTADILYGIGIVAAGAGGYLWWSSRRPATVAVVPAVGDGTAGVIAVGSF
jgi:TolB-like protein